jgi:hypothetical protein
MTKKTTMWLGPELDANLVDPKIEYAIISINKLFQMDPYGSLERTVKGSELITCNFGKCLFIIESDAVFVDGSYRKHQAAKFYNACKSAKQSKDSLVPHYPRASKRA